MNCPNCNTEMKAGYLQSSREIAWSPEKRGAVRHFTADTVDFSMSLISGTNIATYHCPSCKIFLTQYSDADIR
jgi:hypothetical protein